MQKTDGFIKGRLIWKAEQYKLPSKFAFYVKDLESKIQKYLHKQIDRTLSGSPVLFFNTPANKWTLVCTQQVICNDNEKIFRLNLCDIQQILPIESDPTILEHIEISIVKKKTEWDTIKIIDKQNNHYVFYADKGKDIFSLWNILLMAIRLCN